jgi:hypothetical protein
MAKKKKDLQRIIEETKAVLAGMDEYERALNEFMQDFANEIGTFYCNTYLTEKTEEHKERFMHELSTNLVYNAQIQIFYEETTDWYFHYHNGSTLPFLPYERMQYFSVYQEATIPSIEEQTNIYYNGIKMNWPNHTLQEVMEMATEIATETIESLIYDRDLDRNWIRIIKSYLTPMLMDADFLPGVAYREMELMTREFLFNLKLSLDMLDDDLNNNSVRTIEMLHAEKEAEKQRRNSNS